MKTAATTKRKTETAPFRTSALDSARRAGMVGAFDGPADLALNRKKHARDKASGKARAAR